MLIIKVEKNVTLEKALKIYKSKVIKTRQSKELNERKESVKNRNIISKAKYVQKKYKSNND